MRDLTTEKTIRQFMKLFGRAARERCRVYLQAGRPQSFRVGGKQHWILIRFYPELDELYRAIPDIKEKLQIKIELAAPSDFIPPIPGWQDRSQYIETEGKIDFLTTIHTARLL
jgi:hypothetical protein